MWNRLSNRIQDTCTAALRAVLFAAAYFLSAHLGSRLTHQPSSFTAFWPPSGLYLGVLLLTPFRQGPFLVAGAVCGNIAFDLSCGRQIVVCLFFSLGNTLEALTGAYLVRRTLGGTTSLERMRDVLAITVPAVATGGYAEDPVISHPVEHGFTASLRKPYTLSDLGDILEKTVVRKPPIL